MSNSFNKKRSLDEIGIMEGTDKSSLCHGYLDHYAREFEMFRFLPINLIELGVQDGASSRMWCKYFSRAQIVGVDIQERCRIFESGRIKIEIGSQDDPKFLADLANRYPPTIVIDDGSHQPHHQVYCFEQLFPRVAPGGCYVVEDVHINSRTKRDEVLASGSPWPADYFSGIAHHRMHGHIPAEFDSPKGRELLYWADRVVSFHGAAMIWRRESATNEYIEEVKYLEALVAATDFHYGWMHLANFHFRNSQPEFAVRAAERALLLAPSNLEYAKALLRMAKMCSDRTWALDILQRVNSKLGSESTMAILISGMENLSGSVESQSPP